MPAQKGGGMHATSPSSKLIGWAESSCSFFADLTGWGSDKNNFMPRSQQEGCPGANTETSLLRQQKQERKKERKKANEKSIESTLASLGYSLSIFKKI